MRQAIADGTYHWLSTQIRLVNDEMGNPIECVGYLIDINDITLRKQAEEELRTSQRFIQKIADASPNLLWKICSIH